MRLPNKILAASVLVCFFVSGAAGLVYEIVWMRMLGLIFGHTLLAVTAVLVAFMTGLALGASLFGRLIDHRGRPLRVYGLLETGTGICGLLVPALLSVAEALYLALQRALELSSSALSLAQFALVLIVLLLPTMLMGASLPVIAKLLVDRLEAIGRRVGNLYAINTFGAVLGSAVAGFYLLPAIGVGATTVLAATLNLAIGAWALAADRWAPAPRDADLVAAPETVAAPDAPRAPDRLVTWLVLTAAGLSGVASMVYEVAWTRALRLVIGSSVYAFSAMLTTFLTGLALGAVLFAALWGARRANLILLGSLQVAAGLAALALVPVFDRMPDLVLTILRQTSPSAHAALLTQFVVSFVVMIVPTTIIGAAFPCAVQICARVLPRLGRDVGQVYSASTAGTIAGALIAGFVLVPSIGAQASTVAAAELNGAVGIALLVVAAPIPLGRRVAVASTLALVFTASVLLVPRWDRQVMTGGVSVYIKRFVFAADPAALFRETASSRRLVYYREGFNSTVAVERTAWVTSLRIDGKVDASNGPDMATQLMLGHLPVLLHPNPQRVLVIGLGSGVTAGAVAQHPVVREVDVAELEPAVVDASTFFARENRGVLRDPRVTLLTGDGRTILLASSKRYDIIASEPSNPWMAGVANLFSRDFYRLVRQRLTVGGIMVQWLHGYNLFPGELRMIVATFHSVFPHSTLWRTLRGDYLLVGTETPLTVDYALLARRMGESPTVRADMASLHVVVPVDLFAMFLLDEPDLARFARGAPMNTDDRPLLEFAAPLALYAETTDENARLLSEARRRDLPPVRGLPTGLLEARRLHFARIFWAGGEKREALDQLARAPAASDDDMAQLERAKLLFMLGEVGQASDLFARLARHRPDNRLIASYLKASSVVRDLKVEEAMARHGRTSFGDPNPAEALNNLGLFYTQLGVRFAVPAFFDLAVDSLDAARHLEPQAYSVINNLGNAYFELGKLEEAARAYRAVIEVAPREAQAHYNLGLVYEKRGMLDLARREFEAANLLRPAWALPRQHLTQLGVKPSAPTRTGLR